jgi:hypothetical protein
LVIEPQTRYNAPMVKTLELAISKAVALPEAAQEQLGREMIERIAALAELRAAIEIGVRELDAGKGEPLEIEDVIGQARKEHAGG